MLIPDTQLPAPASPAPSRFDVVIDALLHDLAHGHCVKQHTEALKAYGSSAAHRLVFHLQQNDALIRPVALYALQYCWSDTARDAVAALLQGEDAGLRKLAALLLAKNLGLMALASVCEPLLDDPRADVAGFALERLEGEFPSFERARKYLERPELWEHLWKYLPRYYAPELTPLTRRVLVQGKNDAPAAALVALIHQNDRAPETRREIAGYLSQTLPNVREIAAEYFMWHGLPEDSTSLQQALANESDVYAGASIRAAIDAIERRSAAGIPPFVLAQTPPEILGDYGDALDRSKAASAPVDRNSAFQIYALREKGEPHCAYRGNSPGPQFAAERIARLQLQARLFGIPADLFGEHNTYRGEPQAPPADELLPPVRHFFDADRRSYGKDMEDSPDGFGGLVHVGDDMMWLRDHRTVVAIGNGVVRQVSCIPTWGCIVVVEHALADGECFCSLYAHLSPFVCIAPGEVVSKGQKIGAIGRSFTWENGGYIAHLHFGIHEGPFWQVAKLGTIQDVRWEGVRYRGKVVKSDRDQIWLEIFTRKGPYIVWKSAGWLSGYISKQTWESGKHGWVDPQKFIRDKMQLGA